MYVSGFPSFSVCRRLQMIAPWNGAETLKLTRVQNVKTACRLILSLGRELTCPVPDQVEQVTLMYTRSDRVTSDEA